MNRRIRKHRAFINFMLSANSAQQKVIVKSLTSEQYDVISEIALNIYTGTYPLTKKYINQLKPYQSYIRSLGSREVSTKQKRGILLKHLPLVSLLLKPIVHQIDKMAREMILVPKLKYEHLLKKSEDKEEPVKPDTVNEDKDQKQMYEKTLTATTMNQSINDTSQTGAGWLHQ